jgi:CBS domain-containing protein
MQIKDIMTTNVECVSPDDTLEVAALKLKEMEIRPLPVCDRNKSIVGVLTDRDIDVRAADTGFDPRSTLVRQVMSRAVNYCYEDEDADDAARLMRGQELVRIVVLRRDERLAGVVSLAGLAPANGIAHEGGAVQGQGAEAGDHTGARA